MYIMAFVQLVTICTILLLIAPTPSYSYPNGAGDCPEGTTAAKQGHGDSTGTLEAAGFLVSLDGSPLSSGRASNFTVGTSHSITLNGADFEGFLIRIGGDGTVSTNQAINPSDSSLAQVSNACLGENVGGITHISKSTKQEITGTLTLDSEASNLPVDVTVVVSYSETYYSSYILNAVTASTPAPSTAATTLAPVPASTPAPSVSSTAAKTTAPVPATSGSTVGSTSASPAAAVAVNITATAPSAVPVAAVTPSPMAVGVNNNSTSNATVPTSSPKGGNSTQGTSSGPFVDVSAGLRLVAMMTSAAYVVGALVL